MLSTRSSSDKELLVLIHFDSMSTLPLLNADIVACTQCPRLVAYRGAVAQSKRRQFRDWTYWGKPIPGFGDPNARLYILGLAPAAHGGNRTGRVFTEIEAEIGFMRHCITSGSPIRPPLHMWGWACTHRLLYWCNRPMRASGKQTDTEGVYRLSAIRRS